jgi:hypothetical protein
MNGTLVIGDHAQHHVVVEHVHDSLRVSSPELLVSWKIHSVPPLQHDHPHLNHVKRQHVLQLFGALEHGPNVQLLAAVVLVLVLSTVSTKLVSRKMLQHAVVR